MSATMPRRRSWSAHARPASPPPTTATVGDGRGGAMAARRGDAASVAPAAVRNSRRFRRSDSRASASRRMSSRTSCRDRPRESLQAATRSMRAIDPKIGECGMWVSCRHRVCDRPRRCRWSMERFLGKARTPRARSIDSRGPRRRQRDESNPRPTPLPNLAKNDTRTIARARVEESWIGIVDRRGRQRLSQAGDHQSSPPPRSRRVSRSRSRSRSKPPPPPRPPRPPPPPPP